MTARPKNLELARVDLPPPMDDIDPAAAISTGLDRGLRAHASRATLGISPEAAAIAFFDWWIHLASSPGKQLELGRKAFRKGLRYSDFLARLAGGEECPCCIEPLASDSRFAGDAWRGWPFTAMYQAFLLTQQWWHNATTDVKGVAPHHAALVNFATRQMLDMWAPSNFAWTNPEVLRRTREEGGRNFIRGFSNFIEDWRRIALGKPPVGAEAFVPGAQVACTPGKVVFRNRKMIFSNPESLAGRW